MPVYVFIFPELIVFTVECGNRMHFFGVLVLKTLARRGLRAGQRGSEGVALSIKIAYFLEISYFKLEISCPAK